ncbi:MAG: glutathione S-transferase family protein [Burkholderiaceae bacterium]|nr:glutathione S-transferase family protein [Roseateles sp.]MBV8469604.1 glutathione S-transferase family protein [Burkholderiaceae bacterium]
MLTLHYHPSDASLMPHILLEELGVPFTLALVDRSRNAQKSPEYLKLNPNGLIPVLVDGALVLYETAAILMHLADTHPQAQVMPPLGSATRAHAYKWLCWLTNTLQSHLVVYFYAERYVEPGHASAAAEVREATQARIAAMLGQLDAQLQTSGGPWLLGGSYTAADCMAFVLCCWTRNFKRPASSFPAIAAYLQRMRERPAVQRACATEQLPETFFTRETAR